MAVGSERAEESNTSVLTPTEEGLPLLYQAGTYQHKPAGPGSPEQPLQIYTHNTPA